MTTLGETNAQLVAWAKKIDTLSFINPTNTVEAQETFLKTRQSPTFLYRKIPKWVNDLIAEVNAYQVSGGIPSELYTEAKQGILTSLHLIRSVGTEEFTNWSVKHCPSPTKEEVKISEKVLKDYKITPIDRGKLISAENMFEQIQAELSKFGLHDWQVFLRTGISRCRVNPNNKRVLIDPAAKFHELDLIKLVVHEVYGHVFRAENGSRQPLSLLGTTLLNYLDTEEGITKHLERLWKVDKLSVAPYKHTLAVNFAMTHSFSETFDFMLPFCKTEKGAFKQVLRAKRGLGNSSKMGAYTKDVIYLRGDLKIQKYLANGGEFNDLYFGKVSTQHIPALRKLQKSELVLAPTLLPPTNKIATENHFCEDKG